MMLELCAGAGQRRRRRWPVVRDPDPELAHPEAAGWVLGTLDPDDAVWFAGHLPSCPDCRAAVAEFGPTARLLAMAAPADLAPPGLQARTLAGVAQADTPVAGLDDPDAGAGRGGGRRRGHRHRAAAERRHARGELCARAAFRDGTAGIGQRDRAA